MERVTDPADPQRCRFTFPHEQCWNRAEEGSQNCIAHGGKSTANAESVRSYLLAEARDRTRLAELSSMGDPVRELKDTIALTHMLIEKRWNSIKTESDSLAACAPLNQLMLTMDRLCKTCVTLEETLGNLLSKSTVLKLAQFLVSIVIEELEGVEGYEEIIDRITSRFIGTISNASNQQALLPAPT